MCFLNYYKMQMTQELQKLAQLLIIIFLDLVIMEKILNQITLLHYVDLDTLINAHCTLSASEE